MPPPAQKPVLRRALASWCRSRFSASAWLPSLLLTLALTSSPVWALSHADHEYLTTAAAELALAQQAHDHAAASAAMMRMAAHFRARGLWAQVLDLADRARAELADGADQPELMADIDLTFAAAVQQINRVDEALQPLIRALATARRLGNAGLEARALIGLSSLQGRAGNLAAAQRLAEQALVAAQQAGNREWQARALLNQGNVAYQKSEYERALRLVQEAMNVAPSASDSDLPQQLLVAAAVAAEAVAASPEVLQSASAAVEQARAAENGYLLAFALEVQGKLQCELGAAAAAMSSFAEAAGLFDPTQHPYDAGRTQYAWSDCLARGGHYQAAWERAQKGRDLTRLGVDQRRVESMEALDFAYRDQLRAREIADAAAEQRSLTAELHLQRALVTIAGLALLVAMIAVLWLLTRARSARAQTQVAEAAQQARADLLAMAGHEIRNPSQGLVSALAALKDLPLDPQQQQAMNTARHAADMIARLSRDVFNLALSEQDRLVVHRRFVRPDTLVRDAIALVSAAAAAKGIAIDHHDDSAGRRIDIDAERIMQALVNLLTNAVRYTEAGRVSVDSVLIDGASAIWRCAVSDTGPGIPAAELEHVFDPYFRGEHGAQVHGGGLGLAVVQRVIAAHGGQIQVSNLATGGARFRIELPVRVIEAEADAAPAAATRLPLARTRILLVDDDEDVRLGVASMAEHAGATVSLAADGSEAQIEFRKMMPDAVLVDLHLGHERGDQVAQTLKAIAPSLACRWILATGSMSCEHDGAGFDAVLIKPYTLAELLAALQTDITDRVVA
jgi:signal transduction histidine kinase